MRTIMTACYKLAGKRAIELLSILFLLAGLSGCEWIIDDRVTETPVEEQAADEPEDQPEEQEDPVPEEPQDVVATITVLDLDGSPLADVAADSVDYVIESETVNDFDQIFLTLTPSPDSGLIVLSKAGYLDGLVYLNQAESSQTKIVTLIEAGDPIIVDGAAGGNFSGTDGAAVDIQPESLQRPDGATAFGDIELYITPVNTDDHIAVRAFPGSFLGAPEDIDFEVPIYSYGVANISFYQNDEKLQLRDGFTAELTLPMYASTHIDGTDVEVGDSVPFWILNEQSGLWEQNGEALVVADPLSPTGFALNPITTHFSWFNTDAWGNPGSSPGGSGGGGNPDSWCRMSVDIAGVDLDEVIEVLLERRAIGSPTSVIIRTIIYNGSAVEAVLPRGTGYLVRVTKANDRLATAETTIGCADGSDIFEVLDLDPDRAPEFLNWQATVTPVFSVDNSIDLKWEIVENKVTFGGSFARDEDELVLVNAPFMSTPVELPPGAFFEERVQINAAAPATLTARIDNQFGTTLEETEIEFIDFSSPIVDRLVAFNTSATTTEFRWSVEGADEMRIYLLTETPFNAAELGIEFTPPAPEELPIPEDGDFITTGLNEFEGFIRISFTNQYGSTDVFRYISPNIVCPPFSELPQCIEAASAEFDWLFRFVGL